MKKTKKKTSSIANGLLVENRRLRLMLVVVFVVVAVTCAIHSKFLDTSKLGCLQDSFRAIFGGGVRRETTWTSPVGIWPRTNETNDRIQSQLDYADVYRKLRDGVEYRRWKARAGGPPLSSNSTMKYILRVGDFNWEDWLEGQKRFVDDKCPIADCWLTSDEGRSKTADALLISLFKFSMRPRYLPKPAHQIWIVQHKESPWHNRIEPRSLRGLVNWTATYRRDSTIVLPYQWYTNVPGGKPPSPEVNFAVGKTKNVAWFVSNCANRNGRQNYAKELAKFIDVDVYGGCGKLSCQKELCYKMLKTDYKFYLAFENSHCVEYITEKFFINALQ